MGIVEEHINRFKPPEETINLSASSIKDWLSCPKKLSYRRSRATSTSTEAMEVGMIVHNALDDARDLETALALVDSQLKERGDISLEGERKAQEAASNAFYMPGLMNYASAESDSEVEFDILLPGYNIPVALRGRIDRVMENEALCIDWKTSKTYSKQASRDVQAIIYSWAYNELYGQRPKFYFAYVMTGELVEYNHLWAEREEKELFFGVIPAILRDIVEGNFLPRGLFGSSCYNCNYKRVCLE